MDKRLRVLELFAGSRSFTKVAQNMGYKTYTTDINNFKDIDQVCDIFDFDVNLAIKSLNGKPDIIWASPPCTTFSIASIGYHWTGGKEAYIPKTENCKLGLKIVEKAISIIKELNPQYYYIENPRGVLRKLDMAKHLMLRKDVTYCSYGDSRMKPTDIWTNDFCWIPRNMCWNNNRNCHHEKAPRGSVTGVQGQANKFERSKVPRELCSEILKGIDGRKFN